MPETWHDTFGVRVERQTRSAGVHVSPPMANHRLGIHPGSLVTATCHCDGDRHARLQTHGDIDIVPAGASGDWEDEEECTILRVQFKPDLLSSVAEELEIDPARVSVTPRFQYRNSRIEHIALALEAEHERVTRQDRLVVECLVRALALELIATATTSRDILAKRMLSPDQRGRLIEFLESHLESDLSLPLLAQACGVSVTLLKLLFPRSFGLPVHQYVIRRRVERASHLIMTQRLTLSEVASMTGFAHQSHMARMIKRVTGMTPTMLMRTRT